MLIRKLGLTIGAALVNLLLLSCSGEDRQAEVPQPEVGQANEAQAIVVKPGISLRAVSTKPWLVTGGDVLIEVSVAAALDVSQVQLSLNGTDVTGIFKPAHKDHQLLGLLSELPLGDSTLAAEIPGNAEPATLALTNYPITGPIISGPHQTPFHCQTREFELVTGSRLGDPKDDNCSIATRIDYVYWSTDKQEFVPLPNGLFGSIPNDVAQVTNLDGNTVPYIVRVETGTVNRAIYEIALLHYGSQDSVSPWNPSANWNGKLVYTHGGGCRSGWFQQGNQTGGVLRKGLLDMGYAVASSTLNVFGQNCNDLLASETHIMVKERFIEHYGEPVYTIATGASGGSYQSHQTADNYPGVFDGIIVSSSFPDVTSATIFTVADARLLNYYFTETNAQGFTKEQQTAISGFGSWGSIANLSRGAARLDPIFRFDTPAEEQGGEVSIRVLETGRYLPSIPTGVRATVYDHTVNVYGRVEGSNIAARPLDNVGIQYGLSALNEGIISSDQFIALNRDIGGFDRDLNHVAQRHKADPQAATAAIASGRILNGGGGLAATPIIDYRSYRDLAELGDIHMIVHQFSTRQRLMNANGHTDNHVMQVGGRWGFEADNSDLGELFLAMDEWLMGMENDISESDIAQVMRNARPASLVDACWDNRDDAHIRIEEEQTYAGNSSCNDLYRAYPTSRLVAGAPLANDIVSCTLKPLDPADYAVSISDAQMQQLQEIFAEGVCDWSKGDSHGAAYQGAWLSFGPSPVNQLQF